MKKHHVVWMAYARGAGSVLDISPTSRCRLLIPSESVEERLRSDFQRVGNALRYGVDSVHTEVMRSDAKRSSAA